MRENMRIVETKGARLSVAVREGDGTVPAVFLHGFSGSKTSWDAVYKGLPPAHPTIRYDLRGFGASTARDDQPFHHADDLVDLLDAMGIERCDLVGLSMGGAVAINTALDRPDRVRSLSLLSPGITGWQWSADWVALWRPIVEAARAGDMAKARALWFAHPLFASTRESAAAEALCQEIARYSGREWIKDHQAPAMPDVERLHNLQPPTLLLNGGGDLPDFRLIADLIAASAPNMRRADESALGHLLHIEAPEWCCETLAGFWEKLVFD